MHGCRLVLVLLVVAAIALQRASGQFCSSFGTNQGYLSDNSEIDITFEGGDTSQQGVGTVRSGLFTYLNTGLPPDCSSTTQIEVSFTCTCGTPYSEWCVWLKTNDLDPVCVLAIADLDFTPCASYGVHTGTFGFSGAYAPVLVGALAANTIINGPHGYTFGVPAQSCLDATTTAYTHVYAHATCNETLTEAYGETVVFSGGGLRCREGSLAFQPNTVVVFDALGDSAKRFVFRAAGNITVNGGALFVYRNGADASRVFFFSTAAIYMGNTSGDRRGRVGGTLIALDSVQLQYVHMTGKALTRSAGSVMTLSGHEASAADEITLNAPITTTVDLGACSAYSIHGGRVDWPATGVTTPVVGGLIAANTFTNDIWGYQRTTPSLMCFNTSAAIHNEIFASTGCDPTPLLTSGIKYGDVTFTAGVLRCGTGSVSIGAHSVVTFTGTGNTIFRVTGSFVVESNVTFRYLDGASPEKLFFFTTGLAAVGSLNSPTTQAGGTFYSDLSTGGTALFARFMNFTGRMLVREEGRFGVASANFSLNSHLPPSLVPLPSSSTGESSSSSTGVEGGSSSSSTGAAAPEVAVPFSYESELSLSLTDVSPLVTDEELGAAIVAEAASISGLNPNQFVVLSVTTDTEQSTSVVIMRVPLDTARVLEQFVSSSPDGEVYPLFSHVLALQITVTVEPDAPLPYTPFDSQACDCQGVGSCYGGICGCTPTSAEVGECLPGTVPFATNADQICVSRANATIPSPDLCVSNLTTVDAIVYQTDLCQQRMGPRSRNLFPLRLFCQSLDHSIGVDRFTFSGIFGDPATLTTNTTASVFTFRSPLANLAAVVAAGIAPSVNSTRVKADVYLSDIYPLHAAPTLSQFWVQIEFDALYTSQLNGTSGVVVLLKRITGRDTIEGAPNYYWHNNTWNAWVPATLGVLPPSAYAYWNPEIEQPAWACFRNHIYDATLEACVAACDNGYVGLECAMLLNPATCIVSEWNSTTMLYLSQSCDRVVCRSGYEQTWQNCSPPPEVIVEVVTQEPESTSDPAIEVTPVVAVSIVIGSIAAIGLIALGIKVFVVKGTASAAAAAAKANTAASLATSLLSPLQPTVRPTPTPFSELKMLD